MLKGYIVMVTKNGRSTIPYEFRNGIMDQRGLSAEYKYNDDGWRKYGYFPFDDGKELCVIGQIIFTLD